MSGDGQKDDQHAVVKRLALDVVHYTLDEGKAVNEVSSVDSEDLGLSTDPRLLAHAMEHQQYRAEVGLGILDL